MTSTQPKSFCVVMIDDHQWELDFMQEAIEIAEVPIELLPYRNGALALEHLTVSKHRVDLVIADFIMPNFSGTDFVVALHGQVVTRSIPVVLTSTMRITQLPAADILALPAPFLSKPSTWNGHLRLVREMYACLNDQKYGTSALIVAQDLADRMRSSSQRLTAQRNV